MAATSMVSYFQCFTGNNTDSSNVLPSACEESNRWTNHITVIPTPSSHHKKIRVHPEAMTPPMQPTFTQPTYSDLSERFTGETLLQKGSTCIVSKAIDGVSLVPVALKKAQWKYLAQMEREYCIQKSLGSHPNIATMYDLIKDFNKREVYLSMELCHGGDLVDIIAAHKGGMGELDFLNYALQLVDAMSHVHSMNVVHRDIKADNVCTSKVDGTMKIVDFGEAQFADSEIDGFRKGTLPYVAPELLAAHDIMGRGARREDIPSIDLKACDVWSLGITLYAMLTSRLPFSAADMEVKTFADYAQGRSHLGPTVLWKNMSEDAQAVLASMCTVNAHERCTIDEAKDFLMDWALRIGA
eukprot:CFRG8228T1